MISLRLVNKKKYSKAGEQAGGCRISKAHCSASDLLVFSYTHGNCHAVGETQN